MVQWVIWMRMLIWRMSKVSFHWCSNSMTHTELMHLDEPDVIPLLVSRTVDTDLSKMSANEMMMWGLANLWKEGWEGGYSVCHGQQPVSNFGHPRPAHNSKGESMDFNCPNFFEKAFPGLFPYGHGGIEADQPNPINFQDHICWALQFPFVTFGISQQQNALSSAKIQMHHKNFEHDARVMLQITAEMLEAASLEEENGLPISNPAICLLRNHIHATSSHIMGSNQSCVLPPQSDLVDDCLPWPCISLDHYKPMWSSQSHCSDFYQWKHQFGWFYCNSKAKHRHKGKKYSLRPLCCGQVLPLHDCHYTQNPLSSQGYIC